MAFMMYKLAMINSCEIILEKYFFFAKNHCKIQVRTILVCALYSIKYGNVLCIRLLSLMLAYYRNSFHTDSCAK
jgi:hypothetical protein